MAHSHNCGSGFLWQMDELTFLVGIVLPANTLGYIHGILPLWSHERLLGWHFAYSQVSREVKQWYVYADSWHYPANVTFFILCQYYILAPHASLHLITWVDTYMTELKWLIWEGGKERLKFMVAFTNTNNTFVDLLECQYTGKVMTLPLSHVQVIFLKSNDRQCPPFWQRWISDEAKSFY